MNEKIYKAPSGFAEKSSSLRSGIFPESLAFPEAFTVKPL